MQDEVYPGTMPIEDWLENNVENDINCIIPNREGGSPHTITRQITLENKSHFQITWKEGAQFQAKEGFVPVGEKAFALIEILNCSNFLLSGATIDCNREKNPPRKHEGGIFGLIIRGCLKGRIEGGDIKGAVDTLRDNGKREGNAGDGIYLGRYDVNSRDRDSLRKPNRSCVIKRIKIKDCDRGGIVCSDTQYCLVNHVTVENCGIGIRIEVHEKENWAYEESAIGITISRCIFRKNYLGSNVRNSGSLQTGSICYIINDFIESKVQAIQVKEYFGTVSICKNTFINNCTDAPERYAIDFIDSNLGIVTGNDFSRETGNKLKSEDTGLLSQDNRNL